MRLRKLENEVQAIRGDIAAAIAAQEQLNAQLRPVLDKVADLLRQRNTAPASASPVKTPEHPIRIYGQQISRIESRLRGIEQRLERVSGQVAGILDSRIWKTLVRGASLMLKIRR